MLLCLHEESAIAIAHGYAKASGRMMGAVLHSNVGLMHGSMAIFNAWCDRVPMLILGATGPWDAARRRPWIDWIHTASDQGALVRDYTKWDNQPASVPAAYEALLRAAQMANTAPRGPTYINLDAALQEAKIGPLPSLPDVGRFRPPPPVFPNEETLKEAAQLLEKQKKRNEALQMLADAAEIDPFDAELRVRLAREFLAIGQPKRARAYLSFETAGDDPELLLALATVEFAEGKEEDARVAMARVLALAPDREPEIARQPSPHSTHHRNSHVVTERRP